MASNNGVERDGETQRLTVHCSDRHCKKRQCKAIKLSFRNSAAMSDAVVTRIMALMRVSPLQRAEVPRDHIRVLTRDTCWARQETSAQMEKSLGDVLRPSRGNSGKRSKNSKGSKGGKSGKGSNSVKPPKSPTASKGASSSTVPKVELPAQKRHVMPAEPPQKAGKGQPTPVTQMGMQAVKMPSPAIREAAEMCVSPPIVVRHSAPCRDVAAKRLRLRLQWRD